MTLHPGASYNRSTMRRIIAVIILPAALLISCVSPDDSSPPQSAPAPAAPNREVSGPEPAPEPETEAASAPDSSEGPLYEVSQEVYDQTFEEIEALIDELNGVISKRQFNRWTEYLSDAYVKTYNSRAVLSEINQYPQLKDNDIVLKSLKDYFDWVVVPSRSRAVLDDIVFAGEDQVTAYSSFEGKRATLYELQRMDGEWKITVW